MDRIFDTMGRSCKGAAHIRLAVWVGVALGLMSGAVAACPSSQLAPSSEVYFTLSDLYEPKSFDVVAGGNHYFPDCPGVRPMVDQINSYFAGPPDFRFHLTGSAEYRLLLRAESDCDTTLLLMSANMSWYFDDDDGGEMNPAIMLTRPTDGALDVWVGTFEAELCDAVLTLESFDR